MFYTEVLKSKILEIKHRKQAFDHKIEHNHTFWYYESIDNKLSTGDV